MTRTRSIALSLALLALCTVTAHAEPFSPEWNENKGVTIGLQFQTNVFGAEDPSPNSPADQIFVDEVGHGAMFHIGYTFGPTFCLRFSGGGAVHETTFDGTEVTHATGAVEAHYRFLRNERARPYLLGGLGGSVLEFAAGDLDSRVQGGAAVFGGGFLYAVTRTLLIDLTARIDAINWTEIELKQKIGDTEIRLTNPVDENGSSLRFMAGFTLQL